ncbi:MAG: acyl-CoA thioesterase [Phycisphaerales bacterium]|nr:acyl-CoA thioesterase [Phycisphaerales bacterium]
MNEPLHEHTISIRVRYCECDPGGVAHHSVFPIWFEMGRTELLRRISSRSYRELEAEGLFLVVAKLEVSYRRPAKYDDQVMLETRLVELRRAKIIHEYTLLRDGEVLASGATTLACVDQSGMVKPIPDWLAAQPA